MAIIHRRGAMAQFDPSKLLAGEFAYVLDRAELYFCYSPGNVKKIATFDDMVQNIDQILDDITNAYLEQINNATDNANASAANADNKALLAEEKANYALDKGQQAQAIVDSAAPIINTNLQATYSDKATGMNGTFITSPTSDNALAEITKIEGETQVIPADPMQDISPDNVAELRYAEDFEVVSCGKNLLRSEAKSSTHSGIIYTVNSDGSITANGTSTAESNIFIRLKNYDIRKGTYTLSGKSTNMFTRILNSKVMNVVNLGPQSGTFTVDEDLSNCYVQAIILQGKTVTNETIYPQLELGSTATPYEPYKEDKINISFPFMSIPNGVKNTIELINGVWTKVERVKEFVLDGTESWFLGTLQPTNSSIIRFSYNNPNIKISSVCASDKFKFGGTSDWGNITSECITTHFSINQLSIIVNKSRLATQDVQGFKTWLQSNPVTVQYELATPIYTPIDPLYLKSYKGITHLFTTSDPQVTLTANFKSELWADTNFPDGNLKDATVDFTQATEDAELVSGSKMSGLFGLIKKKFADILVGLGGKIDKTSIINNDTTGGIDKVSSAEVAKVHGQEIDALGVSVDEINNNLGIQRGSFVPFFFGSSVAGNNTYTARTGYYYKIGKLVTCDVVLFLSQKDSLMDGQLRIGGLPFPIKSANYYFPAGTVQSYAYVNMEGYTQLGVRGEQGTTEVTVHKSGVNKYRATLNANDITGSSEIMFQIAYETD